MTNDIMSGATATGKTLGSSGGKDMSVAAAIVTLVGVIGSTIVSQVAAKKQREEQKKIQDVQTGTYYAETAEGQRRYETQLAMTLKQQKEEAQERARQWKWNEEDRNYVRAKDFSDRFVSFLDRYPQYQQNLLNVWGRKS